MTAATSEITDGTKKRLREAMESLVADRGFDAVSVRDITGVAKANVAAVNYHFGSREGMIQHVIESQLRPLIDARNLMLAEPSVTETATWLPRWHEAIRAMFADADQLGFQGLRIMGRCWEMTYALPQLAISQEMRTQERQCQQQLADRLPALTHRDIQGKMRFCEGALLHIMIHGHLNHDEIPIYEQWEMWQQSAIGLFTDETLPPKRSKAPKAKAEKSESHEKTMPVEDVSALATTPVDSVAENATSPTEPPATAPEDDGYGGMFLF